MQEGDEAIVLDEPHVERPGASHTALDGKKIVLDEPLSEAQALVDDPRCLYAGNYENHSSAPCYRTNASP